MIKNEKEKSRKVQQIKETEQLIAQNRELLKRVGVAEDKIEEHIALNKKLLADLRKEVDEYDKLKSGEAPCADITAIGDLLVKLRIFRGLTQKELAAKLNIDETQVSRDERNRYKGVSLNRLLEVIDKLDVEIKCEVVQRHGDVSSECSSDEMKPAMA